MALWQGQGAVAITKQGLARVEGDRLAVDPDADGAGGKFERIVFPEDDIGVSVGAQNAVISDTKDLKEVARESRKSGGMRETVRNHDADFLERVSDKVRTFGWREGKQNSRFGEQSGVFKAAVKRIERLREIVGRADQYGDTGFCKIIGDPPTFGNSAQHKADALGFCETDGASDLFGPMEAQDQRDLPTQDKAKGFEVDARKAERADLSEVVGCFVGVVKARIVERFA